VKIICESSLVNTPIMRVRVVCGREEVIAIFSPMILFKSVDLPTLGPWPAWCMRRGPWPRGAGIYRRWSP
jgi:hypothetical protein